MMEGYYSQMTHTCNFCNKIVPTYGDLVQHKKIHIGDRPFSCHICHKRFTQKAHLNIHKRTHTGEKPYACPICHKRFAQSSHLNSHRRIHADDRPYFCVVCNTGFSQKHRFDAHLPCMQQSRSRSSARISAAISSAAASAAGAVAFHHGGGGVGVDGDLEVEQKPDVRYLDSLNQQALMQQLAEFSAASEGSSTDSKTEHIGPLEEGDIETESLSSGGAIQTSLREEPRAAISAAYLPAMSSHRRKPAYIRHVDSEESSSNQELNCKDEAGDSASAQGNGAFSVENNDLQAEEEKQKMNVFNGVSTFTEGHNLVPMPANQSLLPTRISPLGINNTAEMSPATSHGRASHRISLVNFTADELLNHMMSRGDVHRCDFCHLIFQDAAMYHMHRNMHDKNDLRCCNLCGKLLQDRYDFTAHFLNEHR